MKFLSFLILSLSVYHTVAEIGDTTYDLVKGVLDGKLQPVYDSLLKKANPGFVMTADYLNEHKIPLPWIGFQSTPILHYAFGGGTEAHFRISSMLLAAGADPNLYAVDYPPAILFAFGYGREEPNQDMAATIQEVFKNEKYRTAFQLEKSLSNYNKLMNYTNNPGLLEYSMASRFIHGAFALISGANLDINAANADNVTPLHYAAFHGLTSFIDLFLTHPSISPWATDAFGRTPLQLGILRGHMAVVQSFLNSSALGKEDHKNMLMMRDDNGHSALDLALLPPVKVDIARLLVSVHRSLGINVPSPLPQEVSDKRSDKKDASASAAGAAATAEQGKRAASADITTSLGWRCSPHQSALESLRLLSSNSVPTVAGADLTLESFTREYLMTQRPVLIQSNLTAESYAWGRLSRDDFTTHFKNIKLFSVASGPTSTPAKVSVKDWLTKLSGQPQPHCSSPEDVSEDCKGAAKMGKAGASIAQSIPLRYHDPTSQLSKEFPLLPLFSMCTASPESERFNYIQLNIGGYSSGEGAHAHGNSYEVQLIGRRKVVLIPPGALGPRDYSWGINSQVLEHYEQLLSFKEAGNVHEVYQYPGDVLFVPSGWVHASINFCDSVTISTEFCSGVVDDMAGLKVPFNIHRQLYGSVVLIEGGDENSGRDNDEF